MQRLNFLFGVQLGVLVMRHTNSSSCTLRYTLIQGQRRGRGGEQVQIGTFFVS